ncbi:MAG TPA: glycosyltransferase [Kiritimatiellia bacterium]|nr:glycosyltransferase [Kiritimatiellia bacterium]HMO98648.1 glycosyltransferase [Kiritimatiellia bacterium]
MSDYGPRVSIVTSTYNRAEVIRAAITSVLAQDFVDWEMCVVGDCTPDDTEGTLRSYGDSRLRFYNLPVKSPPGSHGAIAKNHAIFSMAKGDYIAYLDDDDIYRPNYLSTMMGYMQANPAAAIAYCRCMYRDKKSGRRVWGNPFQRWLHGYSREKLKRYNFIDTDCVVHKKSVLDEVGGWNPDFYFDDYELWLRISEKYDFHYLNRVLVEKYVSEPPFLIRAFNKGWKILRHGRTNPLE